MRNLIRYLVLTLAAFLVLNVILPQWQPQEYPRDLGPQFTKDIRMDLQKPINIKNPEVILLGNSVIVNGIDGDLFLALTGRRTLHFAFNGAASAYYYLILKNIIATAQVIPKYVLVFFIDNWLTRPDLMVSGGPYLTIIDEVAGEDEKVLLEKAYLNQLDPLVSFLDSRSILFGERQTLKEKIDNRLKYPLPDGLLNCGKTCLDSALDKAFYYDNMLPNMDSLNNINDEWSGKLWDFPKLFEESFLPDILQTARQNGIRLVFIREKNSRFMTLEEETRDMRQYFQDLEDYLDREGIPLLDFSHDPALSVDLFHDQMHLNPAARPVFTRLVAEKFKSIISDQ